ncbi:MAG: flippase-like domain-containing protein [Bacteroides sp.]|nr:flippase-like domain-containing protein [Bacteroides sp.]
MGKSELSKTGWKVALATSIGIGAVAWMFSREFNPEALKGFHFDARMIVCLFMAAVAMCGRDFGLAWRFRSITDGELSWKRAFQVDLMCAFTSAVTPSAVGGSPAAIFYLTREGISVGRATTLTLTTLLLDELFFVVFCPVLVLLLPFDDLFGQGGAILGSVRIVFWTVYFAIVLYTGLLYAGILWKPQAVARTLMRIFSLRWLRRWQGGIKRMTDNMIATSAHVRGCTRRWWLQVFGATVVSWFSRYLVVNALFWGFVPSADGVLVFGRQFVVWVVLMVSPTPGGSGVSEWLFSNYYGDLIGNVSMALVLAIIWRLYSYYVYLVAGAFLVPRYFRKKSK